MCVGIPRQVRNFSDGNTVSPFNRQIPSKPSVAVPSLSLRVKAAPPSA